MEDSEGCSSGTKLHSKAGILDLPLETQHDIFKHVGCLYYASGSLIY